MIPYNKNNAEPLGKDNDKETMTRTTNHFNTFFANVGKDTFDKSQSSLVDPEIILHPVQTNSHYNINQIRQFQPEPTNWQTITITISHMKNSESCGSDGITLRFLKDSLPVIISYLTCIINTSITTGVFPTAWKHSTVVPIHKSGDVKEPSNYRPISLLSVLSKVLEKIVSSQLSQHLETNNLHSNTQHGFRSHLSTNSAQLKLNNNLNANMDNKKIPLVTLCDLSEL